jgi:hypothetical protein
LEVSSHVTSSALDGGVEQSRPSCTVKLGSHVSRGPASAPLWRVTAT